MILQINTKDRYQIVVALNNKGEQVASLSEENEYGSQVLLPLIEKLLKKIVKKPYVSSYSYLRGRIWEQLKGIEVETGPGSFTGLRVGVSVANALGYSLGIPVNGKQIETDLLY